MYVKYKILSIWFFFFSDQLKEKAWKFPEDKLQQAQRQDDYSHVFVLIQILGWDPYHPLPTPLL